MGLRCSLLGHTFVEEDVTRERQDRGSEVLTITREIERCRRCGAERVLSENTEVTSVASDGDASAGRGRPGGGRSGSGGAGATRGGGGTGGRRGGGETSSGFSDVDVDPPEDPADEDAEILTDEEERQPGQWPDGDDRADAGDPGPRDQAGGSTDETAGAGGPADAGGMDGGEIIDAEEDDPDTGDREDAGRADGVAGDAGEDVAVDRGEDVFADRRETTTGSGRDGSVESGTASGEDSSGSGGGSSFEPVGSSVTVPEGYYECTDCGFTVDADTSFRDGDVCPECRQAYLEYQG